ncbi:TraR/DksA family transcriptional regulator [Actinoplanes sp. CA-252034]|uniref:TraR/DksA family transcriptional regulator n=1 Tax=Actinoplanes sp. CA-252034 TaxID=3239906 RepID=UPI003D974E05
MSTDVDRRFAVVHAALTEELDRQTARLRELTEMSADTGDPGEAHTQEALLAATRRSVEQVSRALRRVADGAYGQCEGCAGAIPAERLEVLPHARFCVPCQQKQVG